MSFAGLTEGDKEFFQILSEGGTYVDYLQTEGLNPTLGFTEPKDDGKEEEKKKEATKARGYTRPSWPWRDDDRDSSAPRKRRTNGRSCTQRECFRRVKIVQITSNAFSSRSTRAGK